MNLIVTDFDGTFYDDNYLKNIEFINNIRDNYDFVIATGRNYKSLKEALKIECKYYICNDGGYILDNNENIIYKNFIDNDSINVAYNRMKELEYDEYFFDFIDHFDTKIDNNINKLSIRIKNNNADKDMKYILKDLQDIYGYLSERWINILSNKSKKENAIETILNLNNYNKIYVIGNEINDYGMLNKYNGYLVSNIKKDNLKTIKNFLELEKELL